MFRLPVCPHCGTVYHYKDVLAAMKHKSLRCYHCKKEMKVCKKGILLLLPIAVALSVICNIIIMNVFHNATVWVMLCVSLCIIIAAYFLRPFFITFKSNEQKKR